MTNDMSPKDELSSLHTCSASAEPFTIGAYTPGICLLSAHKDPEWTTGYVVAV